MQNQETATSPSVAANKEAPRLPSPAPPDICVHLPQTVAAGLQRICHLTGQTPGEVAAVLLMEYVSRGSSQPTLCAAAAQRLTLHAERRQELQFNAPLTSLLATNPVGLQVNAGPIRIPLSRRLNEQLYSWAVESGLTREEIARIMLLKANLEAIAGKLGRAPSPGPASAASN